MSKIVECVPNFSEGRDTEKIEKILAAFRNKENVKLVNSEADKDYNRVVVTVMGEPTAVRDAVVESAKIASELIDLREHTGEHSRMGALDVAPYIPIKNMEMEECIELAKQTAELIHKECNIPCFLYENAASNEKRRNLAYIRKGQFEKMAEKIKTEEFKPDYGTELHESAGATAVGARLALVAYNIDLDTPDIEIAQNIARVIRHSGGGFRYIKAGGVYLEEKNSTQVTMNITDYTKTSIYRVFETVKFEAKRYGVNITGSEIVGLTPMQALIDSAEYYLKLKDFSADKIIETELLK